MTPERWRLARDLVYRCLELEPSKRSAYLAQACDGDEALAREVESLVEFARQGGTFLDSSPLTEDSASSGQQQDPLVGSRIGPYQIVEELGRGGMGAVYLAVRDDGEYQQQVAIKLVKRGMDTDFILWRFRYERQILAFLNHPNIARLLDGGSTADGRPYFVMEYVQGRPITDYCLQQGYGVAARLTLFRRVCTAVEHAHRNLIVHRDLKPGNILITPEGVPKLLDFGIAKILVPESGQLGGQTGPNRILTPEYASPEQYRGQPITTVADVYALGAILYELLTGRRAHEFENRSPAELERVICTAEPPRPSAAAMASGGLPGLSTRLLQGDIDNIVLKALEKDPARRYQSVEQLSEDIRRHLKALPVSARPATLGYRLAKFLRRHRGWAAAAALVAMTLIGGILATSWQARIARLERDRAERRYQDVRKLAKAFLVEHDAIAAVPGGTASRNALVTAAVQYLDRLAREAGDDPELQHELALAYEKMGDVQGRAGEPNLGSTAEAIQSYRKALSIREDLLRRRPGDATARSDLASTYVRLSGVLKVSGDYQGGLAYDRKALAIRQTLLASDPGNRNWRRLVAQSLTTLGGSLSQVGEWDSVLEARSQALEMWEKLIGEGDPTEEDYRGLALAQRRMGNLCVRNRDYPAAMAMYGKALETARAAATRFTPTVPLRLAEAGAYEGLGNTELERGHFDAAIRYYRRAHAIYQDLAALDPNDARAASLLAASYFRIGRAQVRRGAAAQGLAEFQAALRIREDVARRNPMNAGARGEVAESYASLGDAYAAQSRAREALAWYTRADEVLSVLERDQRLNYASAQELSRIRRQIDKLR